MEEQLLPILQVRNLRLKEAEKYFPQVESLVSENAAMIPRRSAGRLTRRSEPHYYTAYGAPWLLTFGVDAGIFKLMCGGNSGHHMRRIYGFLSPPTWFVMSISLLLSY